MEDDKKQEIILEQWKTCVESADNVSNRRDVANGLLVTLNLALVATAAGLFNIASYIISGLGILLCIAWFFIIQSYRKLNQAKFQVINDMEKELPRQPFNDEWDILKNKMKKKYIDQTKLEKILPSIFLVLYVVIIVLVIVL